MYSQIDNFSENLFNKERQRLLNFDSLTVLDYIKTSIEILMQMKLDEQRNPEGGDKEAKLNKKPSLTSTTGLEKLNETPLSSTIKSLDPPPKEYEAQLQLYESEVRNHIKCEQ